METKFIDPVCVPDVFATEMVEVEDLGGVFRFSFAAKQGCELVLVSRVCLLASAVPDARKLTARAVAHSTAPVFKTLTMAH